MTQSFSFAKRERLTSKKEIDALFLKGEAFFIYPFKVIYQLNSDGAGLEPLKVVLSVPKRNFKRANKRNHLRRLMKETYRLQKGELRQKLLDRTFSLNLMLVYTQKEEISFHEMMPKTKKVIDEFLKKLESLTHTS